MNNTSSKMTLVDILNYLHELSEKGMSDTPAFDQSHDLYVRALMEENDSLQIKKALRFLTEVRCIANLNISNMIESLENK